MAGWHADPVSLAVIGMAATLYAAAWLRLRSRGRSPGARGPVLTGLAVAVLVVAVASPLDGLAEDRLFLAHMCQHILIGDVAGLLVAAALTGALLRPVLARAPMRAALRRLGPAPAAALWIATIVAWHVPALYDAAVAHPAVHAAEHLSLFAAGLTLWTAVLAPVPSPDGPRHAARLAALATAWAAGMVLANVLVWSDIPLYEAYRDAPRTWGLSVVGDQRVGGGIMLVEMTLVMASAGAWVALGWFRHAERATGAGKSRSHGSVRAPTTPPAARGTMSEGTGGGDPHPAPIPRTGRT